MRRNNEIIIMQTYLVLNQGYNQNHVPMTQRFMKLVREKNEINLVYTDNYLLSPENRDYNNNETMKLTYVTQ